MSHLQVDAGFWMRILVFVVITINFVLQLLLNRTRVRRPDRSGMRTDDLWVRRFLMGLQAVIALSQLEGVLKDRPLGVAFYALLTVQVCLLVALMARRSRQLAEIGNDTIGPYDTP